MTWFWLHYRHSGKTGLRSSGNFVWLIQVCVEVFIAHWGFSVHCYAFTHLWKVSYLSLTVVCASLVPMMVPKTTAETLKHKINPSLELAAPQAVDVLLYTPGTHTHTHCSWVSLVTKQSCQCSYHRYNDSVRFLFHSQGRFIIQFRLWHQHTLTHTVQLYTDWQTYTWPLLYHHLSLSLSVSLQHKRQTDMS